MATNNIVLDCYTDEPAGLGVPPYLGTYPRYIAGWLKWSTWPPAWGKRYYSATGKAKWYSQDFQSNKQDKSSWAEGYLSGQG